MVLGGVNLVEKFFEKKIPNCQIEWYYKQGQSVLKNQIINTFDAPINDLIPYSCLILNMLNHYSGISTKVRKIHQSLKKDTPILVRPGYRSSCLEEEKRSIEGNGGTYTKEESLFIPYAYVKKQKELKKSIETEIPFCVEVNPGQDVSILNDFPLEKVSFQGFQFEELEKTLKEIKVSCKKELVLGEKDEDENLLNLNIDSVCLPDLTDRPPDNLLDMQWEPL